MATDEKTKECARLHAAYGEMRKEMSRPHFVSLMEAFEADLKDDAFAYLPVEDENVEAMQNGGRVKWPVFNTPRGRMIALFTSKDEVAKHPAGNSVGVRLPAFVRAAFVDKAISGILVNPLDGHHGIPVDRASLEVLVRRVSGSSLPQMHPGVVSNAVYRLWDIAVGVPTSVYDVSAEVKLLGGFDKALTPLLKKWSRSFEDGSFRPPEVIDYVKTVLKDVVATGFVYGAMALKHPDKALEVDVERCIDGIPDLRDDIGQNVDEYLILLSDAVRSDLIEPNEEHVHALIAANIGIIAFGAFSFGLGWGMAKDAESQGVMALAELRDRQQKWIEDFKEKVIDNIRKQEEGKKNEDGK